MVSVSASRALQRMGSDRWYSSSASSHRLLQSKILAARIMETASLKAAGWSALAVIFRILVKTFATIHQNVCDQHLFQMQEGHLVVSRRATPPTPALAPSPKNTSPYSQPTSLHPVVWQLCPVGVFSQCKQNRKTVELVYTANAEVRPERFLAICWEVLEL